MAFKLTTQINVQVNGGQLTTAATKIRQKLQDVVVKVNIEPTDGSLNKLRPAISKKLNLASFPFKVHITRGSLNIVRKELQQVVAGTKTIIDVTVNPKALGQVTAINKAIKKTGAVSQKTGSLLEKLGKDAALALRRFGAFTVATTIVFGFIIAVKQAVSEAIEFERQIVKVSQVTGKSIASLGRLKKEITDLSIEFGVSSIELAETARILSQTGISAREVTIALRTLAKTQLAPTFGDLNKTTEASIAIMRQFGGTAADLEKQLSAVNAVAGKFAVESDDIAVAVRRTGGAFRAAGGDLNELIALFTSVRSTTRESAESIATGFRTIFTRLQRTRTQSFLSKLGIDLRDSEGQFIGPLKAIEALSKALKTIDSTDPRFAAILEELGGFRQISKAIPLIQQFAVTRAALNVIEKEGSTLDRDAAKAQQTLAVRIDQTKQEFVALIREISDTVAFRAFVDLALNLASALIKIATAIKPLIPLLGVFGAITLGKAIGPITKGFIPGLKGIGSKNQGGLIPGRGPNVDTVAAVLTKGEFVLQRKAVDKIGIKNLKLLNAGKFNKGGAVASFAHGGSTRSLPTGAATILPGGPTEIAKLLSAQFAQDTAKQVAKASKITKQDILRGVPLGFKPRTPIVSPTPDAIVSGFTGSSTTGSPTLRSNVRQIPATPRAGDRAAISLAGRASSSGAATNLAQLGGGGGGGGFNLNNFLLLSTIAGGVASTFSNVNEKSSAMEKTFAKLVEGFTSVTAQLFLFSTILNNINLQKGLDSLGGFVGKLKGISLSGFGGGGIKGAISGGASRFAGSARGFFTGGARASLRASASGQLAAGKLSAEGLKGSLLKAGVIGIVGNAIGGAFKETGLDDIAKTGKGKGLVQAGGALSGAATGAAIGSFLGPLGIAAGAAIGGLVGFFNATKEAEEALKEFNREGFRKNLAEAQQLVSAGKKLTPSVQAKLNKQLVGAGKTASLANNIVNGKVIGVGFVERLQDVSTPFLSKVTGVGDQPTSEVAVKQAGLDLEKDAEKQIANIKLQVQSGKLFKDVLDDNSISLAQFGQISRAAGEDMGLLKTALEDVNLAQAEASKILKAMAVSAAAAFVVFKNMQALSGNIRRAASAVQTFDATLAALRGDVLIPETGALFRGASEGTLSDKEFKKFQEIVLDTGLRTGVAGEDIAKSAIAEATLSRILPTIIKDLVVINNKDLRADQTRIGLIESAIANSLEARLTPTFGKKEAEDLATEQARRFSAGLTLGTEEDASKIAELTGIKNIAQVQKNNSARNLNIKQAGDAAKLLGDNLRQLSALTKQRIDSEVKLVTFLNRAIELKDRKDEILQRSRDPNGSVPLSQRLNNTRQQLQNILNTTGVNAGASPQKIKDALNKAQEDQIKFNKQLAADPTNEVFLSLADNQTAIVKKLSRALNLLATSTKNATNIQKDLNKVQSARQNKLDRATIETFGSFRERQALKDEDRALALAKRFRPQNLSDKTRELARSAIRRLGPKEGNKILKDIINSGQFGGAGITSPDVAENTLDAKLEASLDKQIEAAKLIADNQRDLIFEQRQAIQDRAFFFNKELDSNKEAINQRQTTNDLLANIKKQLIDGLPARPDDRVAKAAKAAAQAAAQAVKQRVNAGVIQAGVAIAKAVVSSKIIKHDGGFIPGVGNSDSVDARLTPGEFVIRKESAAALGPQFLNAMNKTSKRSTKSVGAGVRFQEGGFVDRFGDGGNVNLQGVATFNIAVSNFVSGVNTLSSSLDAFPREITGNFRHSIEVIFNGAEIMTRLLPEIQDIALNTAKSELRKFVSEKLPDIGPLD